MKSKVRRKDQGCLWEKNRVSGNEPWSKVRMQTGWSVPWHPGVQAQGALQGK